MTKRPANRLTKSTPKSTDDKAGIGYWQAAWQREAPDPVDLDDARLTNHMNLLLGDFLARHLPVATPGQVLIEAGCGGSAWLPVFATRFGYRVRGVDYSEQGCQLARAVLRKAGVTGEILQADLFHPPQALREQLEGQADVVFSQGLVEHFTPTRGIVERLAWLARPGGLVLTLAPNMRGLTGLAQRWLDSRIFALHTPLTPEDLAQAHRDSGLVPLTWGHLGALNLGVVNPARWARRPLARKCLGAALAGPSLAAWLVERLLGKDMREKLPNAFTSPLVYCVARKPGEQP